MHHESSRQRWRPGPAGSWLLSLLLVAVTGCDKPQAELPEPQPRAVSIIVLDDVERVGEGLATGVAGAWKSEDIGFEVSGRVSRVIEPDMDIQGEVRIPVESDTLDVPEGVADPGFGPIPGGSEFATLVEGTTLAEIDPERYRLAVERARARLNVAERLRDATEVEATQTVPAQVQAALAEQQLATSSFERMKRLADDNAASESDLQEAKANFDKANARVLELRAAESARQAELESRKAEVAQARQDLDDALKDLEDCRLVSSIPGQVARVHVVQGSYVRAGEPVVTVQMMDPIKVEVEVSAARSRSLKYRDVLPVFLIDDRLATSEPLEGTAAAFDHPDHPERLDGFVYMADTVADPQSRTFTVTLLVRNRKIRQPLPERLRDTPFARATDIWRVDFDFLPGVTDASTTLVEEKAIQTDASGNKFLWKVNNRQVGDSITEENVVMEVTKVLIDPDPHLRIPFLGNWNFVPFTFREGVEFDPQTDLVVGNLTVDKGDLADFDGPCVVLDIPYWMLRPGDLVRVDLSGSADAEGILIPVEAVVEKSGRKYVFVVDGAVGERTTARRVEIDPLDHAGAGTAVRIAEDALPAGTQIVAAGVHYIEDGETLLIHEIHDR